MRYTNVRVTENNTKRHNKTTEYAPLAQLVEKKYLDATGYFFILRKQKKQSNRALLFVMKKIKEL